MKKYPAINELMTKAVAALEERTVGTRALPVVDVEARQWDPESWGPVYATMVIHVNEPDDEVRHYFDVDAAMDDIKKVVQKAMGTKFKFVARSRLDDAIPDKGLVLICRRLNFWSLEFEAYVADKVETGAAGKGPALAKVARSTAIADMDRWFKQDDQLVKLRKTLARHLGRAREARGMSIEDVVKAAGLSSVREAKLLFEVPENASVTLATCMQVADVLGLRLDVTVVPRWGTKAKKPAPRKKRSR